MLTIKGTTTKLEVLRPIDTEDFKIINIKDAVGIPTIDPYADNNIFGSSC